MPDSSRAAAASSVSPSSRSSGAARSSPVRAPNGQRHVPDRLRLAQQAGRNADKWEEVRKFLPLLSQERWYTQTRRGYARGWEPVRYVENVQAYLNILEVSGTGTPALNPGADPTPDMAPATAAR